MDKEKAAPMRPCSGASGRLRCRVAIIDRPTLSVPPLEPHRAYLVPDAIAGRAEDDRFAAIAQDAFAVQHDLRRMEYWLGSSHFRRPDKHQYV